MEISPKMNLHVQALIEGLPFRQDAPKFMFADLDAWKKLERWISKILKWVLMKWYESNVCILEQSHDPPGKEEKV